jgi:pimeloyl-ACP methyl ester carboxylesterase
LKVPYPYPVQYSKVFDTEIAWCESGSGARTILFVHGLAGYIPMWNLQFSSLSEKYRCVALDLPGNGKSPAGKYQYSQSFYAETVAGFIETVLGEPVVLCGHSMGGQISLLTACRFPELVEQLILIASSGIEYFYPHEAAMIEAGLDLGSTWMDERYLDSFIRQSFYREHPMAAGMIHDLRKLADKTGTREWHNMVLGSIRGMLREPMQAKLPEIEQRSLLIYGLRDALIPNKLIHPTASVRSIAMSGAALLPAAECLLLEQSGHFPMIEEHTAVNLAIEQFLG